MAGERLGSRESFPVAFPLVWAKVLFPVKNIGKFPFPKENILFFSFVSNISKAKNCIGMETSMIPLNPFVTNRALYFGDCMRIACELICGLSKREGRGADDL